MTVTFLQTIKLFKYIYWYSDNTPSIDLASATTQKFIDAGGKIAFSLQFPQNLDLTTLQGFLPIRTDTSGTKLYLELNVKVVSDTTDASYPNLETTSNVYRVRSFYP